MYVPCELGDVYVMVPHIVLDMLRSVHEALPCTEGLADGSLVIGTRGDNQTVL